MTAIQQESELPKVTNLNDDDSTVNDGSFEFQIFNYYDI